MNATARRLLHGGAAARAMLALNGLLGALTAVAIVAQAALMAYVVSEAFIGDAGLRDLEVPLALLAAVALLRAALAGGFELTGRIGAVRVLSELRERVVEHVLVAQPARSERSGDLAAAAVQGVDALENYFARYLPQVILTALVPPVILVVASFNNLPAAIVLLLTAPLIPIFMILIGRSAEDATRARWKTLSLLSAHFLDVVRGLPTLRAHGRARHQEQVMEQVGTRFKEETMATLRIAFISALVLELMAMIGTGLVAAVVGVQLAGGSLGFQAGLTVLILAPELYQPFRQVGVQYHAAADGVAAAETIFDVLDRPAAVTKPDDPVAPPSPAAANIVFAGVSHTYSDRSEVLRELELTIPAGESLALVGESGAGKSTIAALAMRLTDPSGGSITCGGVDLRDVDPTDWHSLIAWLPQRAHIFATSLRENVLLGARSQSDDAAALDALHAVGLDELVATLPAGLDTVLGAGGRELSLGEQQRVGLARVIARRAPLVVLDEPTAYLDRDSVAVVERAIDEHFQSSTVLLITHDSRTAELADHIFELRPETGVRRADAAVVA